MSTTMDPYSSDGTGISGPPSTPDSVASQTLVTKLIPIMVENPDGSMSEGVPPGYKEKTPPRSPRSAGMDGMWGSLDAAGVHDELLVLQQRHQRLFVMLIVLQFLAD